MNTSFETRIYAVETYLKGGISLRNLSHNLEIPYQTIHRWVKWYRKGGKENLKRQKPYVKTWNRLNSDVEQKVVYLKEKEPNITVQKAKYNLEKQGIALSSKGIWNIWKRYGYAGFKKESMTKVFTEYIALTKEAKIAYQEARKFYNQRQTKESARILNAIPCLPNLSQNEFIARIPDSFLNLRRRIEKTNYLFGKTPLFSYLKIVRQLYEECVKTKQYHSALRVGIMEVITLGWIGKPMEELKTIKELKIIIKNRGHSYSYLLYRYWFILFILEGVAQISLSRIKKAYAMASRCRRYLNRWRCPSPYFMCDLAGLYLRLEEYKKAEYWYSKALEKVDEERKKIIQGYLASIYLFKGECKKAIDFSKEAEFSSWIPHLQMYLFRALLFLTRGKLHKAIELSEKSLSLAKKEELVLGLFSASFIVASCYCCLGQREKAIRTLSSILGFLVNNRLKREEAIVRILISKMLQTKSKINLNSGLLPSVKLALLVKNRKYHKAFAYAKQKGLLTYFHRYIFFFPEVVTSLLEKGKQTELPRAILRLPVFNKEIPVYYIKFMGSLNIYKNQKHLTAKLQPKDCAFMIQLALRAGEPNKIISLDEIYGNFWRDSKNPPRNLSHLLVRIKKALKIPSHLLEISYKMHNPILMNKGIHFIADYDEYRHTIVQAQAFLRAGEWEFSKKEYLCAFKLFRDEPFKKMYDPWSEQMRRVILNKLEKEAISFVKSCLKYKNTKDAKKILEKILKIIPCSREIKKLLREM
ncbi:MAG: hypothetical protein WBB67_09035 [bacterium]